MLNETTTAEAPGGDQDLRARLADKSWLKSVPDKQSLLAALFRRIDALKDAYPHLSDRQIENSAGLSHGYIRRLRAVMNGNETWGFNFDSIDLLRAWLKAPPASVLRVDETTGGGASAQ